MKRVDYNRYLIAVVPPEKVCEKIEKIKYHFRDNYNSRASLHAPPHVTLHMPFEWKDKKEDALCDALKKFFLTQSQFDLELLNFSSFPPKTIFVDVVTSQMLNMLEERLHDFCKKELNLFNARYKDLPFHPHITVAFRDLSKTTFAEAWTDFRSRTFSDKFTVSKISLLKHNTKVWEPLVDFYLN